jgi:hypothetical protein
VERQTEENKTGPTEEEAKKKKMMKRRKCRNTYTVVYSYTTLPYKNTRLMVIFN